jgi:hypothetical protein
MHSLSGFHLYQRRPSAVAFLSLALHLTGAPSVEALNTR